MGDTWGIKIGLPSPFPCPPNGDLCKLKLNPDLKGRTHLNQLMTEVGGGEKKNSVLSRKPTGLTTGCVSRRGKALHGLLS